MVPYKKLFKTVLLEEKDEAPVLPPPDEAGLPPVDGELPPPDALPPLDGGTEAAADVVGGPDNLEALSPNQDIIDKYTKAQTITSKLDAALVKQLINRIEEIDTFVERIGGLSEDSLLNTLKRGAESNDTLSSIYDREHRSIGKVSAALSSLSQNLKSYL